MNKSSDGFSQINKSPDWHAQWIWQKEDGPANTWLCFRKKIKLSRKPLQALTRIAAENKYWLYINGSLVIVDGGMDLRPDLSNTYFDSLNIASYLKPGENMIALLVWYKGGRNGYSQHMVKMGGVIFESDIKGAKPERITSDSTWKIKVHPSFSNTPQQQQWEDYKWVEYPVIYDARKNPGNWINLKFNDKDWSTATVKESAGNAPWNSLVHRVIPMMKTSIPHTFRDHSNMPMTIKADTVFTAEIGNNLQGYVYMKIDASAGDTILIRMNEWYTEKYVTKSGLQEYTTYQWQNSSGLPWKKHCVEFSFRNMKKPIRIWDLKFKASGYNTEVLGNFECSNVRLNSLWKKCLNTSYVCMRDQFYDCPDRERGQWWGDVSEQILYSFYLYDTKAYLLARKGFRELLNTQKKDGSLFTTAPGDRFHLPDQNLAAINSIGDYFMYTADTALIRELYPKISDYIKQYIGNTFNSDSVLVLQKKVWNWIDWGDSLDVQTGSANTVVNGLFIRLTGTLTTLAAVVGAREDIRYYQKMQDAVKKHYNSYFWNETQNAYAFHRLNDSLSTVCDDRSNAWAVLAGVVDSTRSAGVLNILRHKLWASPYQERYIEEAMFVLNSPELALKRMLDYYQPDIDSWSQTMWERMGNNSTNNHAWAASPCYLLGAYVAGIKPLKPGFAEYQIMPVLGGLTAIAASVPTVKGMISSVDSLFSNRFTMKVNSPEGTVTILGIPKTRHWRSVTVNGIIIWNDGKYSPNSESILDAGSDEKYIKFKVKPGKWNFTASIL